MFCGADQLRKVLKMEPEIKQLAEELYQKKSLLIMGRGFNYATCLEGALVRLLLDYGLCFLFALEQGGL